MGLFNSKKEGGMMDMIRCDEQDFLIWKWRPEGNEINSTNKENAIRWGSSLRVKEGEVAAFVYKPKSDKVIECKDLFEECQLWLKERNNILHGFGKSKPSERTKNIVEFHHNAIDAAENGLRLTKLVSKWHKQQLQITNKKKQYEPRN